MVRSNVVPQIIQHVLLDMPGLVFFTTYALLVLFWAEIYYQVPRFVSDRPVSCFVNVVAPLNFCSCSVGTCNVD